MTSVAHGDDHHVYSSERSAFFIQFEIIKKKRRAKSLCALIPNIIWSIYASWSFLVFEKRDRDRAS